MGARQKLNAASVNGALVVSAAIGWLCGSWAVFLVTFVICLGAALATRGIRPTSRHVPSPGSRPR